MCIGLKDEVVIWGTGEHAKYILEKYSVPIKNIVAFIDTDCLKHGKTFFGIEIKGPELLKEKECHTVVIGSDKFFNEIRERVLLETTTKTIISIDEYAKLFIEKECETTVQYAEKSMLSELVKMSGTIPAECLQNAYILENRDAVLELLPKNLVVAEVGVAYGDFSRKILDLMEPKHFYGIDFFNKDNPYISFWGRRDFEDSGLTHEEWYTDRFKDEIEAKKMTVCSGYSWDCLEKFEDDFFDYIYLDACHDYESTTKDISLIMKKIKPSGIVQFNDYTLYDIVGGTFYGVVPAVNSMINLSKSKVLYFCLNAMGYYDIVVQINK